MAHTITQSMLSLVLLTVLAPWPRAQSASRSKPPTEHTTQSKKLTVAVNDENAIAVRGARVQLKTRAVPTPFRCETDFAGRCEFAGVPSGLYELRVEKNGFYSAVKPAVEMGTAPEIHITLTAIVAIREVVNVVESPPAIDPAQVSSREELSGREMIDIPYPGPHDYRNALNFVPGVTPDAFGQLHVAGAEGYQTLVLLDGLNVSQPTNGQLAIRTSVDSFRSIQVTPAREPAEFGKGSGGVLTLNTTKGDDHFRFLTTDFIPSPSTAKGLSIGSWTPIYTMSGPIQKGKTWFVDTLDGEFDDNVAPQLPPGHDRDYVWRADNLAKLQSNLTSRNTVTVSFLSNYYHDEYDGLGFLVPQSATPTDRKTAYFGSLEDQYYFHNGVLLETAFGIAQYDTTLTPRGNAPYIELFFSAAGNYYLHENSTARRVQALSNLYLPPQRWHGRHDLKVGIDADRLSYNAQFLRQPISFEDKGAPASGQTVQPCTTDANGVPTAPYFCTRYSVFSGGTYAPLYNTEGSAYVEDRWLITNRLLIEPGVRLDWDQVMRTPLASPRLGATYILDDEGNTKFSAGIGIIYDGTQLGLVHQPLEGQRTDYFFKCVGTGQNPCSTTAPEDVNGNITSNPMPVPTSFEANRSTLEMPRYINSSASLEKKLAHSTFVKVEVLDRRGTHAFAYNTLNGAIDRVYLFGNARDDRYDSFTVSLRHRFQGRYEIFGAYTRSRSHSNQLFDFSLDIPLLSPQLAGPTPWDIPNRFLSWGVLPGFNLPVIHKFDIVYSAEARTGLPFFGTTDQGQIAPGYAPSSSLRFPTYYTLNLQFAKRFHLRRRDLEVRAGFNDITNHPDVTGVNATIDPTHPAPTFIDGIGRAFALRIMLLGKS